MPASKTKPKSDDKPDNPIPSPKPAPVTVQPVHVDGTNRRSDNDACEGCFATIVKGEYEGRLVAFVSALQFGKDGYPTEALVRTRDADNLLLAVPYEDLRPAATNGGR